MGPFTNSIVLALLTKYKSVSAMTHAASLLTWDLEINMPEAGANARGQAQSEIDLLRQKMTLDLAGYVVKAEKQRTLNDAEKGVVRIVKRELNYYQKVPPKLVEELQKATIDANIPWREARKKSDFNIFKPHLEKITELKREEANHHDPSGNPYNTLLDLSEEGLTTTDLDKIFSELIPQLKKILTKTLSQGVFPKKHALEDADYDVNSLKQVNERILRLLGMPEKRFRQDVSTHPFAVRIGSDDVRITTRYEPKDFKASMFGLMHECGHALYELQVDHELQFTPTASGVSAGVHESQSRFWENIVGRSKEFVPMLYPLLKANLSFVSSYDQKQLYSYFNTVKPSLIRVEADELAGRKHPQTWVDLFPEGVAHPGLRQRIRSIWTGRLSREQVPYNELNRSAQINTKPLTKQYIELFGVFER